MQTFVGRFWKLFVLLFVVAGAALVVPPIAQAAEGDFQGDCTPTSGGDGTCTIDEPEGNNPDTHGTITYDRQVSGASDTITFDIQPDDGWTPDEVQVCITLVADSATNPYVPTDANDCAGNDPDRAYVKNPSDDPVVIDLAAFFAIGPNPNYSPGAAIWFAFHVNGVTDGDDRTMYVVGGSDPGEPEPITRTLVVSKDVQPDGDATFDFTVDCGQTDLSAANTNDAGVTFDSGNATFTLGDGDSVTFTGIADGDSCVVTEDDPGAGWTTTVNGNEGTEAAISLDGDDGAAAFVNTADEVPPPVTRSLTVSKDVVPDGAESFGFTVDCVATALSAANTAASGVTFTDGNASFSLGDGGSVTFTGIADGDSCTVAETAPNTADGTWATTINGVGDADRSESATLDQDRTLAFTNTFNEVLPAKFTQTPAVEVAELARTGSEHTRLLVAAGAAFLLAGFTLARIGRHLRLVNWRDLL